MISLTVAAKTLKEAFRQPKNLGITLGLPLAFMVIFGLAFGGSTQSTYDIAVVDHDGGAIADAYVEGLVNLTYDDGTRIFDVALLADEAAARDALASGDHDALVLIPANFSANAVPAGSPPPGSAVPPLTQQQQQGPPPAVGAVATVIGDPSKPNYQAASQIVAGYTAAFAEGVSDAPPAVRTEGESVTASELTAFDFIAPGLMVFAILNMVPQVASVLAREVETKTLDRVRMSPTGAASLLGGVALAQFVIASTSLAIMFLAARLMGFHNQGSYASAYAIALVAAIAVTGIGMIIASIARTQQEAANFGVLVSVPMSFLSGAFFAIPAFRIAGFNVYDLLPTTHAVAALREVMTLGRSIDAVTGALAALAGISLLVFAAGVVLYRRTRLTPE